MKRVYIFGSVAVLSVLVAIGVTVAVVFLLGGISPPTTPPLDVTTPPPTPFPTSPPSTTTPVTATPQPNPEIFKELVEFFSEKHPETARSLTSPASVQYGL